MESHIMTRFHAMVLVACFCVAGTATAGDLWINCSTGSEVFLNGESVGVAESDDTGIRIPGLSPGEHTVSISKNGVTSAESSLTLGYAPTQVVVIGASASAWPSSQIPRQPLVMRPSRVTADASANTAAAPPMANLP